jgi:hypothetical protein
MKRIMRIFACIRVYTIQRNMTSILFLYLYINPRCSPISPSGFTALTDVIIGIIDRIKANTRIDEIAIVK